jgi:hypothetical protein
MPKREEFESVTADVHTLDAKLGLVAQRIKTMEQNEEVIGRTLIAINNRLKVLEEKSAAGGSRSGAESADLEGRYATKQELKELRYTLDMINPLDYATIEQVRDLIDERMARLEKSAPIPPGRSQSQKNLMEKI